MTTYKGWSATFAIIIVALFVALGVSMTASAAPALKSVYIHKYIDGVAASTTAVTASFPMVTTYSSDNLGSAVDAPFTLSPTGWGPGDVAYQASFRDSIFGASYATHEVVGDTVGASCNDGKPFALVGYTTGTTLAEAEDADPSLTAPAFPSLMDNSTYVIVWNESCDEPPMCPLDPIVSDATTMVGESPAVVVTPHNSWVTLEGASWIWDTEENGNADDAPVGDVVFTKTFDIAGTPTDSQIEISADNGFKVVVNSTEVVDDQDEQNWSEVRTVAIPASALVSGPNTVTITVTNQEKPDGYTGPNPGGLLYKLTINQDCEGGSGSGPEKKVHVYKYLQSGENLTQVADDAELPAFPMESSWSAIINGSQQTGNDVSYVLGDYHGGSALKYAADTSPMLSPVSMYKTHEVVGEAEGDVVAPGAQCVSGKFRLVGYKKSLVSLQDALGSATFTEPEPQFDNFTSDGYIVVINEDCDDVLAAQTSTVTMCKVDDTGATPLPGWTLTLKGDSIQDLVVPTNTMDGVDSNLLASGVSYLATVMGTWANQGGANPADAEYSSTDSWTTYMDGYTAPTDYGTDILDLRIGTGFVDWGTYNAAHTYAASFVGTGAATNFNIFDGDVDTDTQNESWFGDNSGTLAVNISKGFAGITEQNGCVTFNNVPYGTYEAGEVAQEGWTNVSGLGPVVVDGSTETFTIVNHNEGDEGEPEVPVATFTFATTTVRAADLADDIGEVIATPTSWFFYNDRSGSIDGPEGINNDLGSFVTGPSTAPLGIGSAQISVPNEGVLANNVRRNIATYQFKDVKLADIDRLEFSTYSQSADNGSPSSERSAYLNFNVDFDNSDTWQRRLVYLPSANGVVVNDSWQNWDAIDGGSALWLYSGATWPTTADPGTSPKTWAQILALYPNAETRSSDSWFGFRVGEPYADGFTGNVDKFIIATSSGLVGHTDTYDFEPVEPSVEEETDNGDDNNGGSGSNSFRRSTNTGFGEVLGAETGPAGFGECSAMLNTYMSLGGSNDPVQVMLLQNFLNGELGTTLAVSGIFDIPTDTAVHQFQAKYAQEILPPWGLSGPTGWVYILTQWKINEILCAGTPKPGVVPLGAGSIISSAKPEGVAAGITLDESAMGGQGDASQSAAVANASSTPGWFGSFVNWLFSL